MKKLLLVLLAVLAATSMSFAQKGAMKIGGDLGILLPMGDNADFYSMGFGICPTFDYMMNEKMAITGTIGYVSWGAKEEIAGVEYSISDIPLKAGFKYYFSGNKLKPYGLGELGFHMMSFNIEGTYTEYDPWSGTWISVPVDMSTSETYLGFAFGGGFEYPMNEKMSLNVLGQYESIMSEGDAFNNLVIKAGLKFGM
ncbi:MAG: outer membrane beta-barrel protein [Deltaproteobacteria bacterium]|nr:outer membrane beta-barrel protein [Deltaproteobacteria bacterium]